MSTSHVQDQMPTDVSIFEAAQNAHMHYLHLLNSDKQSGLHSRLAFMHATTVATSIYIICHRLLRPSFTVTIY